MTVRKARRRTSGWAVWLGGLLLLIGLTGCNSAIEAYRSATGMSKNDPDPATAPFQGNLDKAESGAYPNLASVPEPPTVATTMAERQALTANLTGTRSSTEANGGTAAPGPVPPPPAIPPNLEAPETSTLAQPIPPPSTPLAAARPLDQPPPPLPQNTTMQVPAVANPPGFAAARPAPPQIQPSAMPRPENAPLTTAMLQSGNPQPSPPPTTLPPVPPPPVTAAHPPPKLPPVPVTVASLDLTPGTAAVPPDMQARLGDVVKQYKERPRTVRVVSFAAPATGGAEELNAFRSALDRAQLVAKVLTDAGIPAKQIQTEASPPSAGTSVGRIDVQLMP